MNQLLELPLYRAAQAMFRAPQRMCSTSRFFRSGPERI
jgi:hypothetical protein